MLSIGSLFIIWKIVEIIAFPPCQMSVVNGRNNSVDGFVGRFKKLGDGPITENDIPSIMSEVWNY